MAGKESGGAVLAEAGLFRDAAWLFTPVDEQRTEIECEWIALVETVWGAGDGDSTPSGTMRCARG